MTFTNKLLCSTGAISRYPTYVDYRTVLKYGPQLDVDGFEIMFYDSWYPLLDEVIATLQNSGLSFPAVHTEKGIGVALGSANAEIRTQGVHNLAQNCRFGEAIGAEVLILHLWGWPELDDHLEYNLAELSRCLDIAAEYHVTLAIETIPGRQAKPLENVKRASEQDGRSRVTLDTEFLAGAQQLGEVFSAEWLWQEQLVKHVHIKDFDAHPFAADGTRRYLHPGEGLIDFASFFQGLKERAYHGPISLEAPAIDQQGEIHVERLQRSLTMLRTWLRQTSL